MKYAHENEKYLFTVLKIWLIYFKMFTKEMMHKRTIEIDTFGINSIMITTGITTTIEKLLKNGRIIRGNIQSQFFLSNLLTNNKFLHSIDTHTSQC